MQQAIFLWSILECMDTSCIVLVLLDSTKPNNPVLSVYPIHYLLIEVDQKLIQSWWIQLSLWRHSTTKLSHKRILSDKVKQDCSQSYYALVIWLPKLPKTSAVCGSISFNEILCGQLEVLKMQLKTYVYNKPVWCTVWSRLTDSNYDVSSVAGRTKALF